MRRRRSSALARIAAFLALPLAARGARAQTGQVVEGALEFVLPMGARSVGMGEAAAASAVGADGVWWNPALIARSSREAALAASKTITLQTDAAATLIIPIRRVGGFGLTVRYLNQGEQAATSGADAGFQVGTFVTTSTVIAATFAAPFGDRLAAGLTYKLLNVAFSCTGVCDQAGGGPPTGTQTSALDLGGQYIATKDSLVSVGVALRSLGPRLQFNDAPQADPLPTRFDMGVAYAPKLSQLPPEARVRFAADMISRVSGGGSPGYRLGGELSWRERFQARAGYIVHGVDGSSSATFGVGFSTGRLQIDFAQVSNDAGTGSPPTYLSLRYRF